MQILIKVRNTRVVAIHCQHVLRQVVGTYRYEIAATRNFPRLIRRCRYFNHATDERFANFQAFFNQLAIAAIDQRNAFVHFAQITDHGQHDAQRGEQSFARFDHGAHLGNQNFRMIERHADAAPAKKRIVFAYREIRQCLVSADIQRAHRYRPR